MIGRKTADGIMATFTKAVTQLETVAEQSQKDIDLCTDRIAQAKRDKADAMAEKAKATNFATNLKKLLGD